MSELKAPLCPECGRPLQRDRDKCMYCGYVLNEGERETVAKLLNDEAVRQELNRVQAVLDASMPAGETKVTQSMWFKIVVTVLSVLIMVAFAWVSDWNPVVSALSVLFFSIPIWRVFRR